MEIIITVYEEPEISMAVKFKYAGQNGRAFAPTLKQAIIDAHRDWLNSYWRFTYTQTANSN